MAQHLLTKCRDVDWKGKRDAIHARAGLAHVGEADVDIPQACKLMRLVLARCESDLMDRAPEAVAGMRIIMAFVGRPLTSSGADEDQFQVIPKQVGKPFVEVRA